MRADNSHFIIDAAKRRRAEALARADAAFRAALQDGRSHSVSEIAANAQVSRSWLYAEPTIQDQLAKITAAAGGRRRPSAAPTPHPASDASLRTRLAAALERTRRVEAENRRLRDQLARALGEQRSSRVTAGSRPTLGGQHDD
ncbi:MAG: transposase [Pseudonocardiales bacterium]|nr:MAG: transposase [Pseudonocardiales bacterium]